MPEKLQEIYEKASDIFMKINKKFDDISEKILEQTGTKINVGLIIWGAIFAIFVVIFIKAILGFVVEALNRGSF